MIEYIRLLNNDQIFLHDLNWSKKVNSKISAILLVTMQNSYIYIKTKILRSRVALYFSPISEVKIVVLLYVTLQL